MKEQQFDLTSRAFNRDPLPTFTRMRAKGELVRTKLPLIGQVWLATTYEAVNKVLHDQKNFVLEPRHAGKKRMAGIKWWMPRSLLVLTKNMLTTDEPDHRRLRSLVEQAFMRQSVTDMHERLESLADHYLDLVESKAQLNDGRIDLIRHFARPFPLAVICELLGLPEEDRPKFSQWAERLTQASTPLSMLRGMLGIRKLLRYLKQEFAVCREQPKLGLISALVEAEQDGQRLSEDELLAMAFLLLFAGHETTVHLISSGILTLLEQANAKQELLADWSLAGGAVDETLRYFSPIQITKPRYAAHDLELYGQKIRQGEPVMALLASANSDPAQFESPEVFDIHREPNRHVSFGSGIHVCLGLKLARAEAAIAFEKIFTRFPNMELTIASDQLEWNQRLGIHAVTQLPAALYGAGNANG